MSDTRLYKDEETLRQLYIEQGLSLEKIGDRLGCAQSTVMRYCEKFGIDRRGTGDHVTPCREELSDPDWLREKHHDERKSCADIAEELDVHPSTVLNALHRNDIEVVWRHWKLSVFDDKEQLKEWYIDEGMNSEEIGDMLGVSHTAVQRHLTRNGIKLGPPASELRLAGSDSPHWKGGTVKNYGPNYLEQREKALRRDGYRCVVCGITNEGHKQTFGRALSCHHIKPIREYKDEYEAPEWWEKANVLENLVTLCDSHHRDWEGIPLRPERVV
jgi:DNA-binding CsgD family transcriptional regulator